MDALGAPGGMSQGSIALLEASFTALDRYLGRARGPIRFAMAECDLAGLARRLDAVSYPGLFFADASLSIDAFGPRPAPYRRPAWLPLRYPPQAEPPEEEDHIPGISEILVTCAETEEESPRHAYNQLELLYDRSRRVFVDRYGVYPSLRTRHLEPRRVAPELLLFETAVLLSRGAWELGPEGIACTLPRESSVEEQRRLLVMILGGQRPDRAFDWLLRIGYIDAFWPELAALAGVEHAKELHPEGDAWRHTMETFGHRKAPDLRLSLGLLLHDTGKSQASTNEGRRFDRHAEIGASIARRFLERLGFPATLVAEVDYLVRRHMMPAAFPRLPLFRTQETLEHPLVPLLLELYRCDELSSFKGPDGYYEACAAYRAYLRNVRNPWRSSDGRKLARRWLEGS